MKKLLHFALIFVLFSAIGYAQDESSIKPYLNSGDLAKLSKADKIKSDADRQMEEVRSMNIKMLSLQKDTSISARKVKKQIMVAAIRSHGKNMFRPRPLMKKATI